MGADIEEKDWPYVGWSWIMGIWEFIILIVILLNEYIWTFSYIYIPIYTSEWKI